MKILSENCGRALAMGVWALVVALAGAVRADEPVRGFQEPVRDVTPVNVAGGEITSNLGVSTEQQAGSEGSGDGSETDHWRFRYRYHYHYRPAPVVYYYPVVYPVVYYRVTPYVVFRDGVDGAKDKDGVTEKTSDSLNQRD
jgi:hypothetical protein